MLIEDDQAMGLIAVRDEPRPDALDGTRALAAQDIRTVMLTGDNARTAVAIGRLLGVMPCADLLPEHKAGSLKIVLPWVRATPTGAQVAGGFVTIANTGSAPDRLLGGTIAKGARTEVHATSTEGRIARMRPVEGGLEIKPGARVKLTPGGYHLIFGDLTGSFIDGEMVEGTLLFQKAGTVRVEVEVQSVGAKAPAHSH